MNFSALIRSLLSRVASAYTRVDSPACVWTVSVLFHAVILGLAGGAVVFSGRILDHGRYFEPVPLSTRWEQGGLGRMQRGPETLYQVPARVEDAPPGEYGEKMSAVAKDPAERELEMLQTGGAGGGVDFFGLKPGGATLVFVIDVSGSMLEKTGPVSRLSRAFHEIKQALAPLGPGQKFNIVLFGTRVATLWEDPQQATVENKVAAIRFLNSEVDCGGATDLGAGLVAALGMKPDAILLLTDGEADTSSAAIASEVRYLRGKACPRVQISTVGYYLEKDGEPEKLLQKLAAETGGQYRRWSPGE